MSLFFILCKSVKTFAYQVLQKNSKKSLLRLHYTYSKLVKTGIFKMFCFLAHKYGTAIYLNL